MKNTLLDVDELKATYGQMEVLHGIKFHVQRNEIVVILGANGAGKTTTLRAISGMVETTGRITFNGDSITELEPDYIVGKGIAHVPQGRGTFPESVSYTHLTLPTKA